MNRNLIVPFILIIFLGIGLVFLLSSQGANEEEGGGEETASEEGGEGEEGEEYFFNIASVRKGQKIRERAKVKFDTTETQKGTEAIHVSLT